ncbi:MAG: tRNA (adenosine(37)-N6)-threonylcarbamoyltransferase complex transferase subunit TsaD, partial [Chloroflexi bacterium]|nr:tRNA (adenosine(37)-N6)-threonylcarbamoyltransferase complex transferase subunit TsaD [Chloroflexota bacterium]
SLCTDNAAMIGAAAYFHMRNGLDFQWDVDIIPNLRLG